VHHTHAHRIAQTVGHIIYGMPHTHTHIHYAYVIICIYTHTDTIINMLRTKMCASIIWYHIASPRSLSLSRHLQIACYLALEMSTNNGKIRLILPGDRRVGRYDPEPCQVSRTLCGWREYDAIRCVSYLDLAGVLMWITPGCMSVLPIHVRRICRK